MTELLFLFGSAALTIPFHILSAVPFFSGERVKRKRIYMLLAAVAMFHPFAQLLMIIIFGAIIGEISYLKVALQLYHYIFDVLLWLAALKICFKAVHTVKLLYVILLMNMLLTSVNSISFRIIEWGMPENSYQVHFELFTVTWIAVSVVFLVPVIPVTHRIFKGFLRYELSALPIKNILLLSISPAGFYLAAAAYTFALGALADDFVAGVIIFMGLSFSVFQLLMIRNTRKLLIMEMKHEYLLDNYKTLETNFTQIAQMKHDMRHHLFAIRTLFENGENERLAKYLSDIQDSFAEVDNIILCGNRIIEAVFSHTAQLARQMDFEIEFDVSPVSPLSVSDTNIVSLFMNILNNALESCADINDAAERWIKVELKTRRPYLYFSVTNAHSGAVHKNGGRYASTKNDAAPHGYGIGIVQKIADNNGGFSLFEHTENDFRAEIALPVE